MSHLNGEDERMLIVYQRELKVLKQRRFERGLMRGQGAWLNNEILYYEGQIEQLLRLLPSEVKL